jgi:putative lipoprotein
MRVRGTVRLMDVRKGVEHAQVRVRLLDVSRIDAPAETVAELAIPDCTVEAGQSGDIPFALDVPQLDAGATYALAAHVDISGTGDVSAGDYLTMEHIPVTEQRAAEDIDVLVRPVR